MSVVTKSISLSTKGNTDIIDITDKVNHNLLQTKLKEGIVVITVIGSTAGLTTCEYEPGLIKDLKSIFEKIIPEHKGYAHNGSWAEGNAHSHLRASLLGSTLTIPFEAGSLCLGTWQQIIFIDFDNRSRQRKIILKFIGE